LAFVAETAMLKDALGVLKTLSLYFQSDTAMPITATAIEKFEALKLQNGRSLQKFLISFETNETFKGVTMNKTSSDDCNFDSLKNQFYQAICDNIRSRFPSTAFLHAAQVLDSANWPTDIVQRALYGDNEIAYLSKLLGNSSELTGQIIFDFAQFKRTMRPTKKLQALISQLSVYPISSAACERGFSQMNLQQTSLRNNLLTATVSNLLMIAINGPPVDKFNPRPYVISWLKSGHNGALAPLTGPKPKSHELKTSCKLFIE
jgi:hypothetical protein